jgi:hypothetical protein
MQAEKEAESGHGRVSIFSAEVTSLLKAWSGGDETALDRLITLVHDELHAIARRYMRNEPG